MRNQFLFLGNVSSELTVNEKFTRFNLAVNGRKEDPTDFFSIVVFGKTKELVDKYVSKGMKLQVTGQVHNNNYEKDGQKIYDTSFVATGIEFCEKKSSSVEGEFTSVEAEDLPFIN